MKQRLVCSAASKCPNNSCPHAIEHEAFDMIVAPATTTKCTESVPCATYAHLVDGVGWKGSVCRCVPVEKSNDLPLRLLR